MLQEKLLWTFSVVFVMTLGQYVTPSFIGAALCDGATYEHFRNICDAKANIVNSKDPFCVEYSL